MKAGRGRFQLYFQRVAEAQLAHAYIARGMLCKAAHHAASNFYEHERVKHRHVADELLDNQQSIAGLSLDVGLELVNKVLHKAKLVSGCA